MRRPTVRLSSTFLGLALTACTPRVPATLSFEEEPVARGRTSKPAESEPAASFDVEHVVAVAERALLTIDELRGQPNPGDPAEMDTYLPDQGLRPLYYYGTHAGLSLWTVGTLFGTPVFRAGPHGESPDFHASSVGAYNPEFVARVGEVARALGRDPDRVERTRAAFDRQLRRQALTYLLVHKALHRDRAWYAQFERDYAAGRGGDLSAELEGMNNAFEAAGMSWYETDTAAWFWVRRELDGTAVSWLDALEAVLTAYSVDITAEPPGLPGRAQP